TALTTMSSVHDAKRSAAAASPRARKLATAWLSTSSATSVPMAALHLLLFLLSAARPQHGSRRRGARHQLRQRAPVQGWVEFGQEARGEAPMEQVERLPAARHRHIEQTALDAEQVVLLLALRHV